MAKTKKKPNFLAQGGILAIAGIISRIIGMLYRIPLMNIIGEQGSGIYSTAYEIYNIMLLISSYSLPMAVSKLVSARLSLKQFKNVRQVFLISLLFGAALGLAAALSNRVYKGIEKTRVLSKVSIVYFLAWSTQVLSYSAAGDDFLPQDSI